MIQILNKHVKWRIDKEDIFVCNCKLLVDLKLPVKYQSFMEKLEKGIEKEKLNEEEKKVFSDFEKMHLLSKLEVRKIKQNEFNEAMKILDEELKIRIRNNQFLYKIFKQYTRLFIGIFLDKEIVGIICGFPREDYLLISELAIKSKFHGRGFGKRLVKEFEKEAKGKYKQINVGAEDKAIAFYKSLNYNSFLLIHFKKEDYILEDFKKFDIIRKKRDKEFILLDIKTERVELKELEKYRNKYPKAYFQYIFTKNI